MRTTRLTAVVPSAKSPKRSEYDKRSSRRSRIRLLPLLFIKLVLLMIQSEGSRALGTRALLQQPRERDLDIDKNILLQFKASLPQNCTSLGCADGPVFRRWKRSLDICEWMEMVAGGFERGVTRCERETQRADKL